MHRSVRAMHLIDSLCRTTSGWLPSSEADFVGAVRMSNASLIPAELVIELNTALVAGQRDLDALVTQSMRLAAMLATDRRVSALVCDLGPLRGTPSAHRQACVNEVRAGFAAWCVADTAVLQTLELTSPLPAAAALPGMPCNELVLMVAPAVDAARLRDWLAQLRRLFDDALRVPYLSLWLCPAAGDRAGEFARITTLLAAAAHHVDAAYLLPLLQPLEHASATRLMPWPPADYAHLDAHARSAGWMRSTPGLYAAPYARAAGVRSVLPSLLRMHHQVDVLGIGAAAASRLPPYCFRNHALATRFAADVEHGGTGVARAYAQSPPWLLVSELMTALAGGAQVDLGLLAAKHLQMPDTFHKLLLGTVATLLGNGALTRAADGTLRVEAANDAALGETLQRLHALALVTPSATVSILKPRTTGA